MDWKKYKQVLYIVGIIWLIFIIQNTLPFLKINSYGIIPRTIRGLWGIPFSNFLHGNLDHIISNTVPLAVLLSLTLYLYPRKFYIINICIILISGVLTWIIARHAIHIGASSLIYGLVSFIIVNAIIKKDKSSLLIGILVFIFYSGIFIGVIPFINGRNISWEGHLFGAIAGFIVAKMCSRGI